MLTAEAGNPVNPDARKKYLNDFSQKLIAWGSDDFIPSYLAFKTAIAVEDYQAYDAKFGKPETADAHVLFEKVLLTIRSDLGYDNKGVQQGDLLKMFLKDTDVDQIVQAAQKHLEIPPPKEGKSQGDHGDPQRHRRS